MDYKIREEDGYQIIELSENTKMSLRLINKVINLSSVECDIPELKGICFKEFMKILVKTAKNGELFGKRLSSKTMVELFVFPTGVDNEENEKKAIQKIKNKYAESGFVEEDANNVMTASLCVINKTVNNGDVSKCTNTGKKTSKNYMSSTASSRSKAKGGKTKGGKIKGGKAKIKRTKKRICK